MSVQSQALNPVAGCGSVENTSQDSAVIIAPTAYLKIFELCRRSGEHEIGWFGTIEVNTERDIVYVDDIYLLEQEVSQGTVDITGLADLQRQLMREGKREERNKLLFWGHRHPGDSVFPSGEDEKTWAELVKDSRGANLLMGIFSRSATKAFFRLHYHGMDIRLPWWVQSTNYFPDFSQFVKEKVYTYSHIGTGKHIFKDMEEWKEYMSGKWAAEKDTPEKKDDDKTEQSYEDEYAQWQEACTKVRSFREKEGEVVKIDGRDGPKWVKIDDAAEIIDEIDDSMLRLVEDPDDDGRGVPAEGALGGS